MTYAVKAIIFLILAVLLMSHVEAGGCQLSDIVVSQQNTGKVVEGQREYRVTIENRCPCPQGNIKVRCYGLSSVKDIDISKIRRLDDELCIIVNGRPVTKGSPVIFTYAFKTPQDFPVVSANPYC